MKFLIRRSKALLSIGSFSDEFYKHYGVSEKEIFFAPYSADIEKLIKEAQKLRPRRDEVRGKLGIKPEDIVLIFVGSLVERKRPMDLLMAYHQLITNNPQPTTHLVFVGSGALEEDLEEYAKKNDLENVHLVGFKNQAELPEYYTMADIFVLPSNHQEVAPIVIGEAMSFGLPLVLSDAIPSSTDMVVPRENGYLFPMGDVDALAEKLRILTKSANKRKVFGKKSVEIIRQRGYDRHIDGVLEALNFVYKNKS